MDWTEVAVKTATAGIEPVAGILIMHGINGYTVQDSRDFEEFLQDKEVYWDYIEDSLMELAHCDTVVTFYVTDDAEGAEQLNEVRAALASLRSADTERLYGELSITVNSIAEEDWANNWKKYFKPLPVGKRFLVKPTWEQVENTDGRVIVEIDPSSSFGTGSHTTTKLCLTYIEKIDELLHRKGCESYETLDVGCGSGILGIASYKLSGSHVTGIDIEENSVRVARENFETNHVPQDAYELYVGSITDDKALFDKISRKTYPLLCANIVADVLMSMADCFRTLLSDDGYAVLSGILVSRADEVSAHFEKHGFSVIERTDDGDWTALLIKHAGKAGT